MLSPDVPVTRSISSRLTGLIAPLAMLILGTFRALITLSPLRLRQKLLPPASNTRGSITHSVQSAVASQGWELEIHHVTTPDGHVLPMHRLVRPQLATDGNSSSSTDGSSTPSNSPVGCSEQSSDGPEVEVKQPKKTVLLQHGLFESSIVWVAQARHTSLGFILADEGCDVWLGNNRGNGFASLDSEAVPEGEASGVGVHNWSFEDMGVLDFKCKVQYILDHTGAERITFIGQSQGATQAVIGLSEDPDLCHRVEKVVALSPAFSMKKLKGLLLLAGACVLENFLEKIMACIALVQVYCPRKIIGNMGFRAMSALGFIRHSVDVEYRTLLFSQLPCGSTSSKNIKHWLQILKRGGELRKYDYGPSENMKQYGVSNPPVYDLERITCPFDVYFGSHENVVDVGGSLAQVKRIGGEVNILVEDGFGHADFVWTEKARESVYPRLVKRVLAS